MKKLVHLILVLAVIAIAWLCLQKQTSKKSQTPEPASAVVKSQQPSQFETNRVEIMSNSASVEAVQQPTNVIESAAPFTNALTATNIEQWKAAIKGLHKSPGLSGSWRMEQTNQAFTQIALEKNGQTISYKVRFVDISIKNENGDVLEAQLRSPMMDIDETRDLGLQLCKMLGQDPAGFLAWCDKVGNHWLDTPLFSMGDHYYGFEAFHTFNNEKPWSIGLLIMNP